MGLSAAMLRNTTADLEELSYLKLHEGILRRLELISIDSEHILAVLLMASGAVKNQVVSIPKDLPDEELYRINRSYFVAIP